LNSIYFEVKDSNLLKSWWISVWCVCVNYWWHCVNDISYRFI